jgi:hypothetical protein
MIQQPPPIDDRLHEAARFILDSPAWRDFGAYCHAAALADVAVAAQADDTAGVQQACNRIRALGTIHDALAAIVADAKMKATTAERRRRQSRAEQQRNAP